MVGCRKLNTCNDEDEGRAEPDTCKTTKDDSIDGLTRLDCSKSYNPSSEDHEPSEQGRSDCSEPCSPVAPKDGCEQAGNPEWLLTSDQQERILFEEIRCSSLVSQ